MGRVPLLIVLLAACGGPQIPMHDGYKNDKVKPWLHAHKLKLNDKDQAKAHGDLSYPDRHRAAWYAIELPGPGELDLRVEITPPDESVDDDFDLGFEVFDPTDRVIAKSDLDSNDAGELTKTKSLLDLTPGRYLVHLYLQARLDTAEYLLHAEFKPSAPVAPRSNFPANVQFVGPLPLVPLEDDTPKNYRPPTTAAVRHPRPHRHPAHHHAAPPPPPEPAKTLSARIIGLSVVSGGTQITVSVGTGAGAKPGMSGKITGVPNGGFTVRSCNARTCTAIVKATPDQIKGSGSVVLAP